MLLEGPDAESGIISVRVLAVFGRSAFQPWPGEGPVVSSGNDGIVFLTHGILYAF